MICFRDMTFCPYWEKCASGHKCFRALTDNVKEEAMRVNLPISVFKEEPEECYNALCRAE